MQLGQERHHACEVSNGKILTIGDSYAREVSKKIQECIVKGDRVQQLTLGHFYFFPQDRTVEAEEDLSSNLTQKEDRDTVNFYGAFKIILICVMHFIQNFVIY